MPARTLDVAGVSIPRLGLGTYRLNDDACVRTVAAALRAGWRHLDTAETYGNEVAVGEGIRHSGVPRDEVFVTTKVWHDHLSETLMMAAAEASLARLGFAPVDLYLIHWPSADVPVAAAVKALCRVRHRGLARAVGVSNFPVRMLEEAVAAANVPLAVNQVEYHPFIDQDRRLAALRRHGMGLTAYRPLASGRVLSDPAIGAIARRHGATPAAVALAWLLAQDGVLAIPKASRPERLAENLAAQDIALSAEEIAAIGRLRSPAGRSVAPSFAPRWDDA